jgi:hypothetical protein
VVVARTLFLVSAEVGAIGDTIVSALTPPFEVKFVSSSCDVVVLVLELTLLASPSCGCISTDLSAARELLCSSSGGRVV